MPVPSNFSLTFQSGTPDTVLDKNNVGTGFTGIIPNNGGTEYDKAALTTNTANNGFLDILPHKGGAIGNKSLKNVLYVPSDFEYSQVITSKIWTASTFLTKYGNLTRAGVAIGDFDNLVKCSLEKYVIGSNTSATWNVVFWRKITNTDSTVSTATISQTDINAAITASGVSWIRLYLIYNAVTRNVQAAYELANAIGTRVAVPGTHSPTNAQKNALFGTGKICIPCQADLNDTSTTPIKYDEFAITYTDAEVIADAQTRKMTGNVALNNTRVDSLVVDAQTRKMTGNVALTVTKQKVITVNAQTRKMTGTVVIKKYFQAKLVINAQTRKMTGAVTAKVSSRKSLTINAQTRKMTGNVRIKKGAKLVVTGNIRKPTATTIIRASLDKLAVVNAQTRRITGNISLTAEASTVDVSVNAQTRKVTGNIEVISKVRAIATINAQTRKLTGEIAVKSNRGFPVKIVANTRKMTGQVIAQVGIPNTSTWLSEEAGVIFETTPLAKVFNANQYTPVQTTIDIIPTSTTP